MMRITLRIRNKAGDVRAEAAAEDETSLVYDGEYQEGDVLEAESETPDSFLVVQLDDTAAPALVFLKGNRFGYPVPFGEKRVSLSPRAFMGERHLLYARRAFPEEAAARRNLAFNPLDFHENKSLFPHASANVETRGEAVFAARNAIDGLKANHSHGEWPYTSWGINRDPNAAFRLDFGREVLLDEAVLYLRADFPHDAWWKQGTLHFSDGSALELSLKKTDAGQRFRFPAKKVEWIVLDHLIRADDSSPFPALTQIEFFGHEAPSGSRGENKRF
jgi:hypothetical protein